MLLVVWKSVLCRYKTLAVFTLFQSHLLNVSFSYGDEEIVEFDRKGDPPGRCV